MFDNWHLAIWIDLFEEPLWLHLEMDVDLLRRDVLSGHNQAHTLEGDARKCTNTDYCNGSQIRHELYMLHAVYLSNSVCSHNYCIRSKNTVQSYPSLGNRYAGEISEWA